MGVPRSQLLWEQVEGDQQPQLVQGLLREAGRALDRLDQLDAQLTGRQDEWLRVQGEDGDLVVVVDKALAEARALSLAYTRMVGELRMLGVTGTANEASKPETGGDLVDELEARRNRTA